MKIQRNILLEALAGPVALATQRTPLPETASVRIESNGSELSIIGTNLTSFHTSRCACEGALEATCVPAKLFSDAIRFNSEEVELKLGKTLSIKGQNPCEIGTYTADKFPQVPNGFESAAEKVSGADLAHGLESVAHCVSTDPTRQVLNHVCLQGSDAGIDCVATDGKRFAWLPIDGRLAGEMLIRPSIIKAACEILKADGEILQSASYIHFRNATQLLSVSKSTEAYVLRRNVLKHDAKVIGVLKREDLIPAINAATSFVTVQDDRVRLEFAKDGLSLGMNPFGTQNRFQRTLPGKFEKFLLACSVKLFESVVRASGDEIEFSGVDELSPLWLKSGKLTQCVLPLRP